MKAKVYSSHTKPPLSTNWWALALRGTVALLFGIAAWIIPGITLAYLVFLFGAFALLDGVFNIAGAIRARRGHDRWWALLLVGLAGITAGILTFFYPGLTALTLLVLYCGLGHLVRSFSDCRRDTAAQADYRGMAPGIGRSVSRSSSRPSLFRGIFGFWMEEVPLAAIAGFRKPM